MHDPVGSDGGCETSSGNEKASCADLRNVEGRLGEKLDEEKEKRTADDWGSRGRTL